MTFLDGRFTKLVLKLLLASLYSRQEPKDLYEIGEIRLLL
jgi:hypothetical protein